MVNVTRLVTQAPRHIIKRMIQAYMMEMEAINMLKLLLSGLGGEQIRMKFSDLALGEWPRLGFTLASYPASCT